MFAWVGGNTLLSTGGDGFSAFIQALFFSTLYIVVLFTLVRVLAGEKELEYPLRSLIPQKHKNLSPEEETSHFLMEDYTAEY